MEKINSDKIGLVMDSYFAQLYGNFVTRENPKSHLLKISIMKMFAKSKTHIKILLLLLFSTQPYAMEPNKRKTTRTEIQCNAHAECTYDSILISKEIREICDSASPVLSWNEQRPGAYLLTCDCECSSHDNNGWVIDTSNSNTDPTILRTPLGKPFTLSELEENPESIYDILASHPLCKIIPRHSYGNKIFVSLFKFPTGDDNTPYCFYPAYIIDSKKLLSIHTDPKSDNHPDARVHEISGDTRKKINKMIKILEDDSEREK